MVRSYFVVGYRNLTRNLSYTFINIIGLAIGTACCLLIGLYVRFELSYDDFHKNKHTLYRYIPRSDNQGELAMQVTTPAGLAPYFKANFHEITAFTRIDYVDDRPLFNYGEETMRAARFCLADSTFFQMFSFKLIRGDARTVLNRPLTIVISKSLADQYFPGEDPVGKVIDYDNTLSFEITGVFDDVPAHSHLQFSYLASFTSLPAISEKVYGYKNDQILHDFGAWNYVSYFQIPKGNIEDLQRRLTDKLYEYDHRGKSRPESVIDWLQPVGDIHFTTGIKGDEGTGDIRYVYIFSAVAVLVLLIACFNFMNLSTALALRRVKEVGLRKTLGALRTQLICQFLGETFVLVIIAFLIGFQLVELSLSLFNRLMDMQLTFNVFQDRFFFGAVLSLGVLIAVVSGAYPAFYLSSFQPSSVLRNGKLQGGKQGIRKLLTVLQFGIAAFMIIGTLVVFEQMRYMRGAKLGFDKDQVISFHGTLPLRKQFDTFKQRLLQHSGIKAVTISNGVPGRTVGHWQYRFPEREDSPVSINTVVMDHDYLDVLGLELVDGRKLSKDHASDDSLGYLINEAAVREFMLTAPVGTAFQAMDDAHPPGKIVGVVKDFHLRSLQHKVDPLVMRIDRDNTWLVSVKLAGGDVQQTIDFIRNEWKRIAPERPFDYTFLDESYDKLYRAEEKTGVLMTAFSGLAIGVSCLGLLGLTSFLTQQRRREIGIRKVLGASVKHVVALLSWDFVKLVMLGFIIVVPFAWYAAHQWLQHFAYKIMLNPLIFLGAGGIIILFAILTVGYQSYKASIANPAEVLKEE